MKSRPYIGIITGVILCATGFALFTYVHPMDFLEPGFVRDNILIQDQYILSHESTYVTLSIKELEQKITLSITNPLNDVKLRTEIKDPYGMTIYDGIDSKITFNAESLGNYAVTFTNSGTEKTRFTALYGHSLPDSFNDQDNDILKTSWLILLIIGSYLLVHVDYSNIARVRR